MTSRAVLLDLDGTLIDSVYHHVLAWDEALTRHGYSVALHRIHAGIGIGAAQIVPWLLGRHVDDAESVVDAHSELFRESADRLRPAEGALALIDDLERRDVPFVIATSAGASTRALLLDVLGRTDLPVTDSSDVDAAKPAPDLLTVAAAKAGVEPPNAVMIGDAPWDAVAATRLGVRSIGVLTGGFSATALLAAGAAEVVDGPRDLVGRL